MKLLCDFQVSITQSICLMVVETRKTNALYILFLFHLFFSSKKIQKSEMRMVGKCNVFTCKMLEHKGRKQKNIRKFIRFASKFTEHIVQAMILKIMGLSAYIQHTCVKFIHLFGSDTSAKDVNIFIRRNISMVAVKDEINR